MAPRKPLAEILKHDREYTKKIGDTGEQRPDAFATVAKDLKERLSAASDQDQPPTVNTTEVSFEPQAAPVQEVAVQHREARPATRPRPETARGRAGGLPVNLMMSMPVSAELYGRAEAWGAAATQPAVTVLRAVLKKVKPELVAGLKTVCADEVCDEQSDVTVYRLQSRVRLTADEFADLSRRLDPQGFGVIPSMVNRYARRQFSEHLDKALTEAGF